MILLNGIEVNFFSFPNGETGLKHDGLNNNRVLDGFNTITFKYENDGDLIKLMFLKNYLDRLGFEYVDLTITYMPYSRMDRSENGSPFTLKYVSDFINNLNFHEVLIVEPHSDVTPALVKNSVPYYINFDLLPKVMKEIGFDSEHDYIMFPDQGASKRYKDMKFKNELVGHKVRDFTNGKIKGLKIIADKIINPDTSKVLICDDLSSFGGTFIKSAESLKELGFKEVYLLVAHAENSIFKGELFNHIDKVFTTDSILTKQNNWENKKFEKQLKIYEIEGVL